MCHLQVSVLQHWLQQEGGAGITQKLVQETTTLMTTTTTATMTTMTRTKMTTVFNDNNTTTINDDNHKNTTKIERTTQAINRWKTSVTQPLKEPVGCILPTCYHTGGL